MESVNNKCILFVSIIICHYNFFDLLKKVFFSGKESILTEKANLKNSNKTRRVKRTSLRQVLLNQPPHNEVTIVSNSSRSFCQLAQTVPLHNNPKNISDVWTQNDTIFILQFLPLANFIPIRVDM